MWDLIWISLIVIGGIGIYYSYFEIFFKKRKVLKIEKNIKAWSGLLPTEASFYSNEHIVNHASEIIKLYEECNFSNEQIDLKIEIASLLFDYIMILHGISNNEGSIATAPSDYDSLSCDEDKLSILSRKKKHLEPVLNNLFLYINDINNEE